MRRISNTGHIALLRTLSSPILKTVSTVAFSAILHCSNRKPHDITKVHTHLDRHAQTRVRGPGKRMKRIQSICRTSDFLPVLHDRGCVKRTRGNIIRGIHGQFLVIAADLGIVAVTRGRARAFLNEKGRRSDVVAAETLRAGLRACDGVSAGLTIVDTFLICEIAEVGVF